MPILEKDLLRKALKAPNFSDDTYVNSSLNISFTFMQQLLQI